MWATILTDWQIGLYLNFWTASFLQEKNVTHNIVTLMRCLIKFGLDFIFQIK